MRTRLVQLKTVILATHLLSLGALLNQAAHAVCYTDIPETTPDSRFQVLGDGTVRDQQTGLMWKQCLQGLSGAECTAGTAVRTTWQLALQEAETEDFAGYADWRLPNRNELFSIIEKSCSPQINSNIFPNVTAGYYDNWSSTPVYENDNREKAVLVDFRFGDVENRVITYNLTAFRLVRGGR